MKKALAKALEFEKEISEFYVEKGQQGTNILIQKLFFSLAQQEIEHMMKIYEVSYSLAAGTPADLRVEGQDIEEELRGFFVRIKDLGLKKETTNTEAIDTAIDLEQKGYAMYEGFLAQAADEKEKKFFALLLDQELKHLESLQNVSYYLTGTGDWFEQEESRLWNWMNQ